DERTAPDSPAPGRAPRAAGRRRAAAGRPARGGTGRDPPALAGVDPPPGPVADLPHRPGGHARPRGAGGAHRARDRLVEPPARDHHRRHDGAGPGADRLGGAVRPHLGGPRPAAGLRHQRHGAAPGDRLDGADVVRLPGLLRRVGGDLRHHRERRPAGAARRRRVHARAHRRDDPRHPAGAGVRGVLLPRLLLHRAATLVRGGGRSRRHRRRLRADPRRRHRAGVPGPAVGPRRPAVPALLAHRLDHSLHGAPRAQQLDRPRRRTRVGAGGHRGDDAGQQRADRRYRADGGPSLGSADAASGL
ncbi:MAG: hypothetical protein AVDCRST_MAG69-247, partial [uncultured Solirubrobacteraceae bacterium]